ncbi:SIR2 family protein [Polyangium aurulentum]|uniref:SIR2 family protein n=1 Tax=Polyangium aurulentum TaxID=2567896 RepID=UPI00146F8BF5|nr:SIR2 family protein [Polyangium aurulentum]UQA62793.1 SIR2 family protein [Polyangium aurulentum]
MKAYIKEIVAKQVAELFHEPDARTVLSWWIANTGRKPVVVVGAGFTRNALVKATGELPTNEHVPLWPDVSRQLAEDLGVGDARALDALTLAELHRARFRDRHFYDRLREMLKDDELLPGPAHEALFDFDVEAIVTTNFLDTLLDRDSRCSPIFTDNEVARKIDKTRQIEVLYLHGHRSAPDTWVLSRSQYEDLPKKRPILLARVRQLLSQHPVLTVGFSLVDQDFHQVYREIGLDMQQQQPLGLALLGPATQEERQSDLASAQLSHWDRLGIQIARFKDWNDLGEKFAKFFRTLDRITIEEFKNYIPPHRDFSDRVDLAKSAIEDPNIERYVEDFRGKEPGVWRHCIDLEFAAEDRKRVKDKIQEYHAARMGARGPQRAEPSASLEAGSATSFPMQEPKFNATHLEGRVSKDWELAWFADEWLTTRRPTAEHFADWLHYHVRHELWDQQERADGDSDVAIAELLSVVWRVINDRADASSERRLRDKAIEQMGDAYRLLKKYGPQDAASRVEGDIAALGGKPHETEKRTPQGQARQHMNSAFMLMMNGKYEDATEAYDKALTVAKKSDDPLLIWLAALGRSSAYRCTIHPFRYRDQVTAEKEAKAKEYARIVKAFAKNESVVRWKDEANRRVSLLREKTVKDLRKAARETKYEIRGTSFSKTPHFAWRIFRDLEDRCALPGIQEQYLLPLLEHGFGDPAEELRLRLRFGIDKTKKWLAELLDEPGNGSFNKQKMRDRELVSQWRDAWRAEDATKATLVACVETLPPLLEVLDAQDADLPRELLEKAKSLGHHVEANGGSRIIGHDIARTWREYAYSLRDQASYNVFRQYVENMNDGIAEDELDMRMGQLPWYAWIICEVATPAQLVDWLCKGLAKERPRRPSYGRIQGVGEAILHVVANSVNARERLPAESWNTVANWCNTTLQQKAERERDIDWLSPILSLVAERRKHQQGSLGTDDAWTQVEKSSRQELEAAWHRVSEDGGKRHNVSLAVSVAWCLALVPAEIGFDEVWAPIAEEVWTWTVNHWEMVKNHLNLNPFSSPEFMWFLSTIIEHDFNSHRAEAAGKLLELWSVSSSVPRTVYPILDPKFWSEDAWSQLVDKLREGVGGARGEFSASWRMAISSLLRSALLHGDGPLAEDLQFLVEHVLILVANEEAAVANHAAYTAVYYAESCEETDNRRVKLVSRTLEAMARDVRLPVRQGAAYGAARLRKLAKSVRIRELAERIYGELKNDTYLLIQTQLRIGAAEAEAKSRRATE